jgi:hypothetical protein
MKRIKLSLNYSHGLVTSFILNIPQGIRIKLKEVCSLWFIGLLLAAAGIAFIKPL